MRTRYILWTITILILVAATPLVSLAETPAVWRDLEPGQYGVGFRTIEKYDHSRTFVPKYDYLGNPNEGDRARPIQVCIWYPAGTPADAIPMTYGEYAFAYPEDDRFFNTLARLQDREIMMLNNATGDQAVVLHMMSVTMFAVRDAMPVAETFPLVLYHPSLTGSYAENAVLCEYLASHGFIVATTPGLGLNTLTPAEQTADLENLIRDKELALALMKEQNDLSFDRLGLLGAEIGALAAVDMAMRCPDVEAVAVWGGWFTDAEKADFCRRSPSFNPDRMCAPLFQVSAASTAPLEESIFSALKYAPRLSLASSSIQGSEFIHYPMFEVDNPEIAAMIQPLRESYQRICRYTLTFFKAEFGEAGNFAAELRQANEEPLAAGSMTLAQFDAEPLPPTREQFAGLLRGGHLDTALAIFAHFHEVEPERVLFDEGTVNMLGYRTMQSGDTETAIRIFLMNTKAYPKSCNSWDSLSDGYLAAGDNENAIATMRKALEVMPLDTTNPEQLKEQVRTKCEQTIAELGG